MPYAPRATFDNPYGPQVTFRTEDVLPPVAYYVSPDDRITIYVLTDVPNVTVFLQIRLMTPQGEVKQLPYQFVPTTLNSFYAAFETNPVEGYILGMLVWALNPPRGQCYVSAMVLRNAPATMLNADLVLVQGYTNRLSLLSYPTSPLQQPFDGRGSFLRQTLPTTTGANLVFTTPAQTLWEVHTFSFQLQTSAVVANRVAIVSLVDAGNNPCGFWQANFSQPASTAIIYSFSSSAQTTADPPFVNIAGPSQVYLPAGFSLQTEVANLDAGDVFINNHMLVEEWVGF